MVYYIYKEKYRSDWMKLSIDSIKSPLQMIGFFLAWIETVLAVSLWPVQENQKLLTILLFSLVGIAVIFSLSLVFSLVYLVRNYPQWLFNPGDYDPDIQDELFEHDYSRSIADRVELEAAVTTSNGIGGDRDG